MRAMMARLKLTVNDDKTRLCRVPEDHVEFLGYAIGRCYSAKTGPAFGDHEQTRKTEADGHVQRHLRKRRFGDRIDQCGTGGDGGQGREAPHMSDPADQGGKLQAADDETHIMQSPQTADDRRGKAGKLGPNGNQNTLKPAANFQKQDRARQACQ